VNCTETVWSHLKTRRTGYHSTSDETCYEGHFRLFVPPSHDFVPDRQQPPCLDETNTRTALAVEVWHRGSNKPSIETRVDPPLKPSPQMNVILRGWKQRVRLSYSKVLDTILKGRDMLFQESPGEDTTLQFLFSSLLQALFCIQTGSEISFSFHSIPGVYLKSIYKSSRLFSSHDLEDIKMRFSTASTIVLFLCLSVDALPGRHRGRPGRPGANVGTPTNGNSPQNTNQPNNNPAAGSPTTNNQPASTNTPSNNDNNNNNNNPTNLDPSLVPAFTIQSGTGVGANGVPIPENCPPARAEFISKLSTNIAAGDVLGTPITFNTDPTVQDTKTNQDRATAMIITLQSFSGVKGVGCPGASTPELISQQKTGVVS